MPEKRIRSEQWFKQLMPVKKKSREARQKGIKYHIESKEKRVTDRRGRAICPGCMCNFLLDSTEQNIVHQNGPLQNKAPLFKWRNKSIPRRERRKTSTSVCVPEQEKET